MTSQHHRKDGRISDPSVSFATLLPIAFYAFVLTLSALDANGKLGINFSSEDYGRSLSVCEAPEATRPWLT